MGNPNWTMEKQTESGTKDKEMSKDEVVNKRKVEDTPWDVSHCPKDVPDKDDWSRKCKVWCEELDGKYGKWTQYSLRTYGYCEKCEFPFFYRTSNYSMRSSADVMNYSVCANYLCKHEWDELC